MRRRCDFCERAQGDTLLGTVIALRFCYGHAATATAVADALDDLARRWKIRRLCAGELPNFTERNAFLRWLPVRLSELEATDREPTDCLTWVP